MTVERPVGHEVERADLVGAPHFRSPLPDPPRALAPGQLRADRQPFFGMEPMDPLVVHHPSLLPQQQHVQAPVAVAHPYRGQVLQPHPQSGLRVPPGAVALHDAEESRG